MSSSSSSEDSQPRFNHPREDPPIDEQSDMSSSSSEDSQPRFNHPREDLLIDDNREDYNEICVPLYKATIRGDWKAANKIFQTCEYRLVRYSITENMETALHVAATAQSTKFVKHLVEVMSKEELTLQNKKGDTALSLAAIAGNIKMVEIMYEKNPKLVTIRGSLGMMPLYLAAVYGKGKMVTYLYGKSRCMASDYWTDKDRNWLFLRCLEADLFDIALQIYDNFHGELPGDDYLWEALKTLAAKPRAFNQKRPHAIRRIADSITCVKLASCAIKEGQATQLLRKIWKRIVKNSKDKIQKIVKGEYAGESNADESKGENKDENASEINNKEEKNILFIAAKMGNSKFLIELIQEYPDVMWMRNDNNQTIFHIAVAHRHESIYNLIHDTGPMKDFIIPVTDENRNNMLHLVGKNPEIINPLEEISGAAFQMQRELLWYKEVSAIFPQFYREEKNDEGKTPIQLFTENHKDLLSKGEKWMKDTASQCLVVAALIATIVFAVAFTIPGGYNQNNGFPVFFNNGPFIAFVVLDAISLILSSASILVFLSILTSRYAQNDFLKSLPDMLMIGLATLFLSIVTMMFAFTISFFVLYRNKFILIPCIISVIAVVPIYIFLKLLSPLLVDAYHSTYGSRYRFKPKKGIFYYQNPRF